MRPEFEDRLRAALHARADQVTADKLAPRELPPAAPRRAVRWILPSTLAVAAAGLIAVVAGVAVVPQLLSSPVSPGGTPTSTVPAPSTAAAPTTPPRSTQARSQPPGQGSDRTRTSTTSSSGGGQPAATVSDEFAGVRLPLPAGWQLVTVGDPADPIGCVVPAGTARPEQPRDCALTIRAQGLGAPGHGIIAPDTPGGFRDDPGLEVLCPDGYRDQRAGDRSTVTIDGRTAEYRTLSVDCNVTDFVVQQWVVTDRPAVALVRWYGGRSPEQDRTVRDMVAAASLPAGSGDRVVDYGRFEGYRQTDDGVVMVFDRMIPASAWEPADVNDNEQTYEVLLTPDVVVRSYWLLCGGTESTADQANLGAKPCEVAAMLPELDGASAPGRAAVVWLQYAADGRVAYITEDHVRG